MRALLLSLLLASCWRDQPIKYVPDTRVKFIHDITLECVWVEAGFPPITEVNSDKFIHDLDLWIMWASVCTNAHTYSIMGLVERVP